MRRRLITVFVALVSVGVLALGIPLGLAARSGAEQRLRIDQLADTSWFAAFAQQPLLDGEYGDLRAQMRRYDDLYGIAVFVVDGSRRVTVASRAVPSQPPTAEGDAISTALAGRGTGSRAAIWPWSRAALTTAEPVTVDGRVLGAAVTVSPTGLVRRTTLVDWGLLLLGGFVALAGAALAVVLAVRWILHPVHQLELRIAQARDAAEAGRSLPASMDPRGPPELVGTGRAFDRLAERLADLLGAQRTFVANASHQLRNPLTALRIRLQSMVDRVPDEALDDHGSAMDEVERLIEVVDGLLTLARAEHGPGSLVDCDVDAAVARRRAAWEPLVELEGIALVRVGPTGLMVRAAPEVLDTVLDIALDNAVRFAPPGSAIDLTVTRHDEWVELRVRDRGPGLPSEQRQHAVERFWRGSGQDRSSGTGLGLPIAVSLATRSGGELVVGAPAEGPGLEVVLTLPAAVVAVLP